MPSKRKVWEFWRSTGLLWDLEDRKNPAEAVTDICWACGFGGVIQRCHIHAKCNGGSDDVSNLVLLCAHCHKLQEVSCATEQSRREWFEMLQDGPMYMSIRYLTLQHQWELMTPATREYVLQLVFNYQKGSLE